jgi:(2R)-3-sulfolactate dehydrogenase (NADP+)
MATRVLSLDEATTLVVDTLTRCRTGADNARAVARALVYAEAAGLKGHGLARVPSYAAQAKVGKIDGHALPTAEHTKPGVLKVDAAHGFAYPALELAESLLQGIAHSQGIALAAIRRSHHCGAAGLPVDRLAEKGLVAMLFTNSPPAIAPWGTSKAVFGTNPIAFACPMAGRPPLVIDLSMSRGTRGEIFAARQRGDTSIPDDWALDAEGNPTSDPAAALRGTMRPVGDAKGTVLALMVELLAAGLTGANFATEASPFLNAEGPPPGTGQLIIAIDPELVGGENAVRRFAEFAGVVEAEPGARLPGARRRESGARAEREGLAVDARLLDEIARL